MSNIYPTTVLIWERFFILTCVVLLVDLLSNNDHLRSNLSHAHHTYLTQAETYLDDNNPFQKWGLSLLRYT